MSARGAKSFASLNAGLLGRRESVRRVPLSFAPIEPEVVLPEVIEAVPAADVPEVVRQVERLTLALGLDAVVATAEVLPIAPVQHEPPRRVAFTLRIDPVRHARLRQVVTAEGRSAQQILIDAMDHYCARTSGALAPPAIVPLHAKTPTGKQP